MKVQITRDEFYQVNCIKTIEIEIPDDTEDIERCIKDYLDMDEAIDAFGDVDQEDRWSDVQETWYEITPENGETIQIKN